MERGLEARHGLIAGRVLLAALAVLAVGRSLLEGRAEAQSAAPAGYVLDADGGERLTRGPTTIRVKADPTRGAKGLALGTQLLPKGAGIPVHQHPGMDEVLFVLEGAGTSVLGEAKSPIAKGSAIFIPRGAWHGVQNPDGDLTVMWVVAPPGLEAYFREATPVPGAPPLSREQVIAIAKKHGTIFR